jgi:hypothetical protein
MKRAFSWTLAAGAALAIAFTFVPLSSATETQPLATPAPLLEDEAPPAPKPCVRTEFKTDLVKKACADGGQKKAKRAMKTFTKAAKKASGEKVTCKSCHTKLGPGYPLKDDGLTRYEALKKLVAEKQGAANTPAEEAAVIKAHLAQ